MVNLGPGREGWCPVSQLLLLTNTLQPSTEVLPALGLLSHTMRVAPAEVSALLEASPADALLVDGRRDLPHVRSLCRVLRTTGVVSSRFLQPSTGFTYTWTNTAPTGSRVSNMVLNGVPIDPAASYRVTANNFLTTGGDGFTEFLKGTDILNGPIDLDSFVDYLGAHSPIGVPAGYPRINLVL